MSSLKYSSTDCIVLDTKYFPYPGIPPPLVKRSWIENVEMDMEENDNLVSVAKQLTSSKTANKRKQGRPKKYIEVKTNNEETENGEHLYPDYWDSFFEDKSDSENEEPLVALVNIKKKSKCISNNSKSQDCAKKFKSGNLFKCDSCHKEFGNKYLLKCHKRVHNGELFNCDYCEKGFTTAQLLKVHRRIHTGEKPYPCDQCNSKFPSASRLNQHKERHAIEKKHLCVECGAFFKLKRSLECHKLVHGEKTHICSVCGKRWARKSDLVEHMRVHTRVKPYKCDLCDHSYTQSSSLKRHVLTHKEVNPDIS